MLGKVLGFDITDDSMVAVLVKSGLHGYQIIDCAGVSITEAGGADEALTELLSRFDHEGAVCISAIPSDLISYRSLNMPFGDERKIRQTLAYEIEPMMPAAVEDLQVDFIVVEKSANKANILAAAVERTFLAEHLEFLQSHNLDPEVLDIRNVPVVTRLLKQPEVPDNGLFLNIGFKKCGLVFFLHRRIVLIRKVHFDGQAIAQALSAAADKPDADSIRAGIQSFCNKLERTITSFAVESGMRDRPEKIYISGRSSLHPETSVVLESCLGLPVEIIDLGRSAGITMDEKAAVDWQASSMNNALALAIRDNVHGLGFNFRQADFKSAKRFKRFRKEIRKGAVVLLAILSLLAADILLDYSLVKKRNQELDNRLVGIFSRTFPEVKKIVDPVQQMRGKINEIEKSAGSLSLESADRKTIDIFRDVSRNIPPELQLYVTRMIIDAKELQLTGVTDTFNTVDSIKKGLEAIDYMKAVTISTAKLDRSGQGIQFEIRSQL